LQIWILPDARGVAPSYEQKTFSEDDKRGRLRLVASPDGRDGSIRIYARANVYASLLGEGERAALTLAKGHGAWIHVARGTARLTGETLRAGDGASTEGEGEIALEGVDRAELLVFDLN